MMLSNVIIVVTIPRCSFVFGQSRAKVSAGFTNVRSLAVAAFDLVYCSLSALRFDFVLDISKQASWLWVCVHFNFAPPLQRKVSFTDETSN